VQPGSPPSPIDRFRLDETRLPTVPELALGGAQQEHEDEHGATGQQNGQSARSQSINHSTRRAEIESDRQLEQRHSHREDSKRAERSQHRAHDAQREHDQHPHHHRGRVPWMHSSFFWGVVFALLGAILLNLGINYGLATLGALNSVGNSMFFAIVSWSWLPVCNPSGDGAGRQLPTALFNTSEHRQRYSEGGGAILVVLIAFGLGYLLTRAEPALAVMSTSR